LRLTQLAKPAQELLLEGKLDMGHARALLGLTGTQQIVAAARVVAEGLSVRDAERLVHAMLHPTASRTRRNQQIGGNGDLARLESELADTLGARVRIEATKKGAGR